MNILLVEDEAGIRDGLASFLRIKGHRVLTAASREQGLARIAEDNFDLLITDWRIGAELGDALVVASGCPSIVVSGCPDEVQTLGDRVTVMKKPVMPQDLLRAIEGFDIPLEKPALASGGALPVDVRDLIALALGFAGAKDALRVEDDGATVLVEAGLLRGEAAISDLESLGGDLCVRRGPDGLRFQLRLHRNGRPDAAERVLRLDDTWPGVGTCFAIDCDREPVARLPVFLTAIARSRRRRRGSVQFLNVPSAWRLWIAISGKTDDMPKRAPAGPRLPECLAMLWSQSQ